MIDGLKPYPDYKKCGLPWLGRIPSSWEVRRNGRLFAQRKETGYPDLPILEVSLKTGVRVRDFDNSQRKQVMSDREKYQRACQGDIAYNMMRMWQGAVGVAPVAGLISPAYIVARPLPGTEAAYFAYLFRTAEYMREVNDYSRGIVPDRNRLYWDEFKQIPSPYPPPDVQQGIVRFLDHADRKIRQYVRTKKKLIALLNEQMQAIINQAVTRGLDPNVKLRPSGVEWLGTVPEHWEVITLKHACSLVRDGTHLPPARQSMGVPLLSVRNIIGGKFTRRDDDSFISVPDYKQLCRSFVVEPNDVLLAIVGATLGKVAIVPSMSPFHIQRSLAVLRSKPEKLLHKFLASYLRGPAFQRALWTTVAFSAQPGIYLNTLGAFQIVVPPLTEQELIQQNLSQECRNLDAAIERAHREILLLHEYRTRLIADVITGKLDVREAAARLPDEPEEPEAIEEAEDLAEIDEELEGEELEEAVAEAGA